MINSKCDHASSYTIASSSFLHVPNAASQLLACTIPHLVPNIRLTQLRRKRIIPEDFAKLSRSERAMWFQHLEFEFNSNDINEKQLIIIDDAFVTGLHERAIRQALQPFVKEIKFFYVVDLSQWQNAAIEHTLNKFSIRNVMDILPLRAHKDFCYNSRVLKMLLQSDSVEFKQFISYIPVFELEHIFDLAQQEMLGRKNKYQENLMILEENLRFQLRAV